MMQRIVTYAIHKRRSVRELFRSPSDFSLSQSRWKLVQRFKVWLFHLVWHWCMPMERVPTDTVTRVEVNHDKLLDMLKEQQIELCHLLDKRCDAIVLGQKQFYELTKEVMEQDFQFRTTIPYAHGQSLMVLGMDVIVVPWIDGLFLLPARDQK